MTPASRRIALSIVTLVASLVVALSPSPAGAEDTVNVYRFWSPAYNNAHFYTIDSSEAEQIRATNSNWVYEGVAFKARRASSGGCSVGTAIYRFWSAGYRTHFYTADKSESDQVRATNPNWAYEGIAYCADTGPQNGGTPLYRFWSPIYNNHFYTADKSESDLIRATNRNWTYEGIAYYVNPRPTTAPPPPPPPPPPPCQSASSSASASPSASLPSDVLNLTNWKLTLPVDATGGTTGSAREIDQEEAPLLDDFQEPNWFSNRQDVNGMGVTFRASAGPGALTSSSAGGPRSELREMKYDGNGRLTSADNAGWTNAAGTHTMTVTQSITHLPTAKAVVAGQIHGGDAIDTAHVMVHLAGSTLSVRQGTNSDLTQSSGQTTFSTNYTLGQRFTLKFEAGPNLLAPSAPGGTNTQGIRVCYWAPGASTAGPATRVVEFRGITPGVTSYFKAGCYTQSKDSSDGYGEVIIYGLTVTHQ